MKSERCDLALKLIRPSEWKLFEEIASKFLAADFRNLRTLASESGDSGRDAVLFNPDDDPSVVIQFSVAEDWSAKIRQTVKRLKEKFSDVSILVYVTNQLIGAQADSLRKELRQKANVHLDIRDRSWFVERVNSDKQREIAAEALAERTVDRYLSDAHDTGRTAVALSSNEARAAFVYLKLQWEDDIRDKSLTRVCFESLVRSVLRDSTPDKRVDRTTIHERVRALLPSHPADVIANYVDSALTRLSKRAVRHYEGQDQFCLSFEERVRLAQRLAESENANQRFEEEMKRVVAEISGHVTVSKASQIADLVTRTRRVLERFLLTRGEQFAQAMKSGDLSGVGLDNLSDIVLADASLNKDTEKIGANLMTIVTQAVESIVVEPGGGAQMFVRSLADTYTLLAFLRETPDVQGALVKMFSEGEIWIDSNIILPLLAERLLEPAHRRFTNMLAAAREAGLRFFITPGVLEEVERHINRSLVCTRIKAQDWRGPVPFLYGIYAQSGLPLSEFGRWVEEICGNNRPLDDITEYMDEVFSIKLGSLEKEAAKASTELRGVLQEIWHEARTRRQQASQRDLDAIAAQRLVAHDVENFLGVIGRRKDQPASPFGYTTWWLTLDRTAFLARQAMSDRLSYRPPDSPVLSPDFLVNYIALGPIRARMSKELEAQLPIVMNLGLGEFLPAELLAAADEVRIESEGLPERVIRRRVRERFDGWKIRRGPLAESGIGGMQRDMQSSVQRGQTSRPNP